MSRLPEDWYRSINQAIGKPYMLRDELDRVADALEPLLRAKIEADLRKQAQGYIEVGNPEKASLFESAARIAEEGTQA